MTPLPMSVACDADKATEQRIKLRLRATHCTIQQYSDFIISGAPSSDADVLKLADFFKLVSETFVSEIITSHSRLDLFKSMWKVGLNCFNISNFLKPLDESMGHIML